MRTLVIAIATVLLLACSGPATFDGSTAYGAAQSQSGKPAPATSVPKPDELDRLLAPVALYPDALLAQMLLCTSNPGRVATLNEWLASNQSLKGTELQEAATKAGFDPSFAALVLFPQVVEFMAGSPDWTTKVGQAFTADRNAVFASIQRLRSKASKAGNLKDTPQQDVETRTTSSGEQVIVIEPANPQVVYVPQYDSQVVYTQPSTTTVVVQEDDDDDAEAAAAGIIGFTAGIAIGAAIDNDYYYGPYGFYGGGYMYNDAWDDYYDAREDAREDWQDHREDINEDRSERREDISEERGERAGTAQEQRTERQQNRQQNPESQARRSEAQAKAQQARSSGASATGTSASGTSASQQSRGYSRSGEPATRQRSSSGSSDAFSGYSSGKSTRAASSRGQSSRSSSRGGGSRRGGGRRR
jgi:hypothetical protein